MWWDKRERVKITRKELYDLVWMVPMTRLGVWLPMDNPGIWMAIHDAKIPRPEMGHWAKVEAGKKVRQTPLPHPERGDEPAGTIVKEYYDRVQEEIAKGGKFEVPRSPDPEWLGFERDPANRITVPDVLTDPHPIVLTTEKALRKAKCGHDGRLLLERGKILCVRVTPDTLDRALRIADTLIKAIEARGFRLEVAEEPDGLMKMVVGGASVDLSLEEVCRQEELPPKPQTGWERRMGYPPAKDYRMAPTGALCLRLHDYHNYWRKKWEDGKAQRVEGCLNKFFICVQELIESREKEYKKRAEEARVREEAKQRREKLMQMQQEERDRIAKLEQDSTQWQKSEVIRDYVGAFRRAAESNETPLSPDSEAGQWMTWALAQADRLDPLVPSPPSVLDEKVDPCFY